MTKASTRRSPSSRAPHPLSRRRLAAAALALTGLTIGLWSTPAPAQEAAPKAFEEPRAKAPESAPPATGKPGPVAKAPQAGGGEGRLVVFNREIHVFRSTFLGFTPAERAAQAAERIKGLLARPGKHEVKIKPTQIGLAVTIDGVTAFGVQPADANTLAEETPQDAAERAAEALRQVIAETEESRDLRALLKGAALALAATAIFLLLVWIAARLRRAAAVRLMRLADTHAERLKVGGAALLKRDWLIAAARWTAGGLFWVLVILLAHEWLAFSLSRFPYTRPWGEQLTAFLVSLLTGIAGAILRSLPGLAMAAVIFLVARFVTGLLRSLFDRVAGGTIKLRWLDADTVVPTRKIATAVVWLFALAMAYPFLPGADSDAFKGISVLVGLMISLGATSVVGQAASGLILMYTRTLRAGEFVRIGEHEGTVVEAGLFVTHVRTGLGEELTLPNSVVMAAVTKNYSRAVQGTGFVMDATVTIGYDAPWRQVEAMLLEAARRTEGVLAEPRPRVFQLALSDFYVEYRLACYGSPTDAFQRAVALSALHAHVQDVFNENGVQIMSPHYLGDPQAPKVVPKSGWYAPPARPPGKGGGDGGRGGPGGPA
jgi:small-conductance mechanosensitive channel